MVGIETALSPSVLITEQLNMKDWTAYVFLFSCGSLVSNILSGHTQDLQRSCLLMLVVLFCTILFWTLVHFVSSATPGSVVLG